MVFCRADVSLPEYGCFAMDSGMWIGYIETDMVGGRDKLGEKSSGGLHR